LAWSKPNVRSSQLNLHSLKDFSNFICIKFYVKLIIFNKMKL
jgi:hypothetical protein